jgi:putative hydrolase of the HAD superfamily
LLRIRAITLDLDDTLWEIEPVIRRAEAMLWQWLAENYPRISTKYSSTDVLNIRESVMQEFADYQHDFRFMRKKVLERLAAGSGYATDLIEPAFEVFDNARNEVELFPDVLSNLAALAENFTILALTNGNANLQKIGIDHLFHNTVTATDVGAAKPAREIFEVAIERSGYSAKEILHVGDHPETDVEGARAAGLRTAWMNRTNADWPDHLQRPDVVVTTIADLRSLLQSAMLQREEAK